MAVPVLVGTDAIYQLLLTIANEPKNQLLKVEIKKTANAAMISGVGGFGGGALGVLLFGTFMPVGILGVGLLAAGGATIGALFYKIPSTAFSGSDIGRSSENGRSSRKCCSSKSNSTNHESGGACCDCGSSAVTHGRASTSWVKSYVGELILVQHSVIITMQVYVCVRM